MPRQLKPVRAQPIVKSECLLIDGITLALPRDGSCQYHKSEIADMMLTFGRKYVIDAIAGANCYHSEQRLRKLFPAGKDIPLHKAPGEITVQCLEGRVAFTAAGQTHELAAGQLLYLTAAEPHALKAIEDSSLLVTLLLGKIKAA